MEVWKLISPTLLNAQIHTHPTRFASLTCTKTHGHDIFCTPNLNHLTHPHTSTDILPQTHTRTYTHSHHNPSFQYIYSHTLAYTTCTYSHIHTHTLYFQQFCSSSSVRSGKYKTSVFGDGTGENEGVYWVSRCAEE